MANFDYSWRWRHMVMIAWLFGFSVLVVTCLVLLFLWNPRMGELFHRHVGDRPRRRLFLAAVGFFLTLALARFIAYAAGRGIGPFHYIYIDRKSTRLNSSHVSISYAVFCLKKKTGIMRTLAVLIV